jgi:phospholipid/cholesterol/gamma-HCH transport system substrate-binding protein
VTSLSSPFDRYHAFWGAIIKIKGVGDRAEELTQVLNTVIAGVKQDINEGKGPVNALLKDSSMVEKISSSLDNIQKGTDAFSQIWKP